MGSECIVRLTMNANNPHQKNTQQLLKEGLIDAVGFVVGSLIAFFIGRLIGLDLFDEGYGIKSTGAILLAGLGGGLGVAAARRTLRA
jgi:hypothetical protein